MIWALDPVQVLCSAAPPNVYQFKPWKPKATRYKPFYRKCKWSSQLKHQFLFEAKMSWSQSLVLNSHCYSLIRGSVGWPSDGQLSRLTLKWQTLSFRGAAKLTMATRLLENSRSTIHISSVSAVFVERTQGNPDQQSQDCQTYVRRK